MLFTFKSASNADLIMLEPSGKEILALLGKAPDDVRGIITTEQLPAAINTLKAAMAEDKARRPKQNAQANSTEEADESTVGLYKHAVPFVEMLEHALKDNEPVIWGV